MLGFGEYARRARRFIHDIAMSEPTATTIPIMETVSVARSTSSWWLEHMDGYALVFS
jgi:hypothetical protein